MRQSDIFLDGEGDNWFARNQHAIANGETSEIGTIERALSAHPPGSVLEIGCSNGSKLAALCRHFGARGSGVDPSEAAVREGNARFPGLQLRVGTAANLPFDADQFDLVYFGFCLYLVDRSEIFRAAAEADRVLKPGGFLAVLDFDPVLRHRRAYHHKPGIYSYKTDHARFFLGSGHYSLVAKDSFSHDSSHFTPNSDERVSMSVLYKETEAYWERS